MRRRLAVSLLLLSSILSATILSCSSAANLPNPFASTTPTATATLTPTITPSPPPSPTPTLTPTAAPPPTGVDVQTHANNSSLLHDWDNGYELILPSEWLVVARSQADFEGLAQASGSQDPDIAKMMDAFKQMDPDIIRLLAVNLNPKYAAPQTPTFVVITAITDVMASSMPMDFVTAMIEDNVLRGSTDTTYTVRTNAHGVELGIVNGSLKTTNAAGLKVNNKAKIIAFQTNKKLIMIEFVVPTKFAPGVLPDVERLAETIQLVKPGVGTSSDETSNTPG